MARWRGFKNKAVRCFYCWLSVDDLVDRGIYMTVDHVIPRCKGGGNNSANLVTACERCNNMKADNAGWYGGCVALEAFGNPEWFRDMLLAGDE